MLKFPCSNYLSCFCILIQSLPETMIRHYTLWLYHFLCLYFLSVSLCYICKVPSTIYSRCLGPHILQRATVVSCFNSACQRLGRTSTATPPPGTLEGASATCRDAPAPFTGVPKRPPGLWGHHQLPDPAGASCLLHLPGHVLLL